MAAATDDDRDLVALALALIAERGWRAFSFAELARRAGVPLGQVYAELPDRAGVLRALGRRLDAEMLALTAADLDGLSARERVFELIMRRLDAMGPYKPGLQVIAREGAGDLGLAASGIVNVGRLTDRLVDAAEGEDGPGARLVARHVLAGIYVRVFNVWLGDDSPDLARTLAELDRRLQQAEGVASWLRGMGRRRPAAGAEAPDPEAPDPRAAEPTAA